VDALSLPPSATTQPPPPSQRPSPALTAEDWREEGLVAPDRPILAAFADAQPVDFRRWLLRSRPAGRWRR
jgi:hypothetical protein